jgi:hypothetical protein
MNFLSRIAAWFRKEEPSVPPATAQKVWPRHEVYATSFADPEDVRRFEACKRQGKSDQECFKIGDNGIGTPRLGRINSAGNRVGVDTTAPTPMCALPPEDWRPLGAAAPGAKVSVTVGERTVICELRDTMPAKANVKNGAGIDLNPAAAKALGLKPPFKVRATWQFV